MMTVLISAQQHSSKILWTRYMPAAGRHVISLTAFCVPTHPSLLVTSNKLLS
jgi:hypothetical protein